MSMKNLVWLVLAAQLLFAFPAGAAEKIIIHTNSYEPYYGEQMPDYGPLLQITRLAFKEAGYETEVRFRPWARVIQEGENGDCDVVAGVWSIKGREEWMALSSAIVENEIGFYKRRGDDLLFKDYADLKAKKVVIGTVRAYIHPKGFDQAGLLTEEVTEDLLNMRKLVNNRIRLALVDRRLGSHLLKKEGREKEIEWLATLERLPLRNGIMKKAPGDWKKKLADFNRGLAKIRKQGVIGKVMKEHQLRP